MEREALIGSFPQDVDKVNRLTDAEKPARQGSKPAFKGAYTDVSDRRMQAPLTPEAEISSSSDVVYEISAFAGFISSLREALIGSFPQDVDKVNRLTDAEKPARQGSKPAFKGAYTDVSDRRMQAPLTPETEISPSSDVVYEISAFAGFISSLREALIGSFPQIILSAN